MIKGSNYLEELSKVETVFFDKTGTLTKGNFTVTNVNSKMDSDSAKSEDTQYNEYDLLKYAS